MSRDEEPMEPSLDDFQPARALVERFIPRASAHTSGMIAIATLTAGAMIARAIYELNYTMRTR